MFKLFKEYRIINITAITSLDEYVSPYCACLHLLCVNLLLLFSSNKLVHISEQTFSTSYHVILTATFGSVVLVVVEVVVVAEAVKNKQ